ncbi:MAG: hypothetical protein U0744_15890 [Gemmataceae bacterium]
MSSSLPWPISLNTPENVDLALVEGAVANVENEEMLLRVRERTKTLVALGDQSR